MYNENCGILISEKGVKCLFQENVDRIALAGFAPANLISLKCRKCLVRRRYFPREY